LVVVPSGCLDDQSGTFHHQTDGRFRYEGSDDGGSLTLSVFFVPVVDAGRPGRRFSRDGGLARLVVEADAGATGSDVSMDGGAPPLARISLRRTPTGFLGVVSTTADGGCAFPSRIIACEPGALVLETIARQARDCPSATDAGWTLQRLMRTDFDAGTAPSDTMRHDGSDATPPPAP